LKCPVLIIRRFSRNGSQSLTPFFLSPNVGIIGEKNQNATFQFDFDGVCFGEEMVDLQGYSLKSTARYCIIFSSKNLQIVYKSVAVKRLKQNLD